MRRTPSLLLPILASVVAIALLVDPPAPALSHVDRPEIVPPPASQARVRAPHLTGRARVCAAALASTTPQEAEAEPRERSSLPLTFEPVDAETGNEVLGVVWDFAPNDGKGVPEVSIGDLSLSAAPGSRLKARARVRAPAGLVAWDPGQVDQPVSRYAKRLRYVYPLRREANVVVDAEDGTGKPVSDVTVEDFEVGGRYSSVDVVTEHWGHGLRVRGIPHYADVPVRVLVTKPPPGSDDCDEVVVETVEILEGGYSEVRPRSFDLVGEVWDAAIAHGLLPRRSRDWIRVTACFEDPDVPVTWSPDRIYGRGCGDSFRRRVEGPTGVLEVRVTDANGRPVFDALVDLRRYDDVRTDEDGIARFPRVPEGWNRVHLREPGLVFTRRDVEVQAGCVNRVDLQEDPGGTLHVRVLDPEGEPAPFAEVGVHGWIDLQDGVQRLDRFVDQSGERTLRRVRAIKRRVSATWAGYTGDAEVRVEDGGHHEVTVHLKAD